jgi:hypothetical protein
MKPDADTQIRSLLSALPEPVESPDFFERLARRLREERRYPEPQREPDGTQASFLHSALRHVGLTRRGYRSKLVVAGFAVLALSFAVASFAYLRAATHPSAGTWQTGSSPTHNFSAPGTSVWAAYGAPPRSVGPNGPLARSVPPGGILIRLSIPKGARDAKHLLSHGTFVRLLGQASGATYRLATGRVNPLLLVRVHFGDKTPSDREWSAVRHELQALSRHTRESP